MSLACHFSKHWSGFELDIDLETSCGRVGLLGISGSGKTQTLRCLAGLTRPDEGRIDIRGRTVFDSGSRLNLPPARRQAGYLFQQYALFPHLDVAANIAIGLLHRSKADKQAIIRKLAARFHIESLLSHYPHQLSGGQQQRVALARCLAPEPDILLLDEPFAALDGELRQTMVGQLAEDLEDYEGTVIFVSHDMDEVYQVCHSIAIIDGGRIVERGSRQQLFAHPSTLAGARLAGCRNLSRVVPAEGRRVFAVDWGLAIELPESAGDQPDWIGIRAHDLEWLAEPRADSVSGQGNFFELQCRKVIETRFDYLVRFDRPDLSAGPAGLVWETPRRGDCPIRPGEKVFLQMPPDKLLLLSDNQPVSRPSR